MNIMKDCYVPRNNLNVGTQEKEECLHALTITVTLISIPHLGETFNTIVMTVIALMIILSLEKGVSFPFFVYAVLGEMRKIFVPYFSTTSLWLILEGEKMIQTFNRTMQGMRILNWYSRMYNVRF